MAEYLSDNELSMLLKSPYFSKYLNEQISATFNRNSM